MTSSGSGRGAAFDQCPDSPEGRGLAGAVAIGVGVGVEGSGVGGALVAQATARIIGIAAARGREGIRTIPTGYRPSRGAVH